MLSHRTKAAVGFHLRLLLATLIASGPPIASDPVSSGSPFNSQSPYIPPLNTSGPVELSAVMSPVSPPSDRPLPINTEAARPRGDSLTSNISSAGFDPGADLSSFDASYTRAYPGRRGAPAVGMGGWKEDVEEEANATSRTWEEDLDRRARAGAELQKRTEEAARREQEEALQAEYWEQERRELVAGPSRPPKVDGLLAGTDEAAWADQQGHPAQHTPPQQHSPPPRQYTPPTAQEPLSPQIPVDAGLPPTQVSQRSNRPPTVDPATEIYQIKHVNLIPPTSPSVQRIPILLQNANGPCPLLALVNAITLSTAPSTNSTLSETLRVREQVSLNLLLQAVFEELMTRGADLPDVGDLFAFLMTLHTGMNVNPRFVDIVPSSGRGGGAGAFEDTKELTLYASFSVPLVHGWLPPPTAPVFSALQRAAPTYEETQTLLFSEEELITRLTSSVAAVPTPAEETLLADARLVREFVETTATQLTSYGLATLRSELPEAQVAILFRNDHFSTIVRRGSELVTLVTDAGFASHEEVVWETLADVSGRDNRFLSGDFRAIGGSSNNNDQRQQEQQRRPPPQPPRSQTQPQSHQPMGGNGGGTNTEDTDHDFALALQLQEEENVREDDARRERERNRTAAAAAAGGDSNRPDLPPRHQQTNTNANTDASGITPPPPYPPPPQGSSSSSHGRTASQALADGWTDVASRTGRRRRAAAGDTQQQAGVSAGGPDPARTDRDKCVIM